MHIDTPATLAAYADRLFDTELTIDQAVDKTAADLTEQEQVALFPTVLRAYLREARSRYRNRVIASAAAHTRTADNRSAADDTIHAMYADPRRVPAPFLTPQRTLAECTAADLNRIVGGYLGQAAAAHRQADRYRNLRGLLLARDVTVVGELSAADVAEVLS